MATRLTTKFVEAVKPVAGKQAGYPDAQVPGLELRVSPGGRKVWSFRFRNAEGRQRRMSLGAFPAVDLGEAIRRSPAMRGLLPKTGDGANKSWGKQTAKGPASCTGDWARSLEASWIATHDRPSNLPRAPWLHA